MRYIIEYYKKDIVGFLDIVLEALFIVRKFLFLCSIPKYIVPNIVHFSVAVIPQQPANNRMQFIDHECTSLAQI